MKRLLLIIMCIICTNSPLRARSSTLRGLFGGAASGALIGGLAGGGRGAAIGSGVGAGVGLIAGAARDSRRRRYYYDEPYDYDDYGPNGSYDEYGPDPYGYYKGGNTVYYAPAPVNRRSGYARNINRRGRGRAVRTRSGRR